MKILIALFTLVVSVSAFAGSSVDLMECTSPAGDTLTLFESRPFADPASHFLGFRVHAVDGFEYHSSGAYNFERRTTDAVGQKLIFNQTGSDGFTDEAAFLSFGDEALNGQQTEMKVQATLVLRGPTGATKRVFRARLNCTPTKDIGEIAKY